MKNLINITNPEDKMKRLTQTDTEELITKLPSSGNNPTQSRSGCHLTLIAGFNQTTPSDTRGGFYLSLPQKFKKECQPNKRRRC